MKEVPTSIQTGKKKSNKYDADLKRFQQDYKTL